MDISTNYNNSLRFKFDMKKFFAGIVLLAGVAALCQCSSDMPPREGSVKLVDPKAKALMTEASGYEQKNKVAKAVNRYRKLVEEHPVSVEAPAAQFRIAQLQLGQKEYIDAFDAYQKFIERYPDSPLYKEALQAQKKIAFDAAHGKLTNKVLWAWDVPMDSSNVVKWLNSVCDNAPFASSAPEALSTLGDYLVNRKRYDEAIVSYQKIVDNYPNSGFSPVAQLAVADLYRGEHSKGSRNHVNVMRAQEAYEDYLQRYPGNPGAKLARNGLNDVRRLVVEKKLETAEYYLNRMKDRDAAIFNYQEVATQSKDNPEAAAKARQKLKELGTK